MYLSWLKPYYLNPWSCVIYGKHAAKAEKKKSAALGHQHELKALDCNHWCVSNSRSPLCLIMCKAHFHIEIRLHFKHGGVGWGDMGQGACHRLGAFVKKKGNCINLIEELLRMLKASAFTVQSGFTHQYLLYCFPPLCF